MSDDNLSGIRSTDRKTIVSFVFFIINLFTLNVSRLASCLALNKIKHQSRVISGLQWQWKERGIIFPCSHACDVFVNIRKYHAIILYYLHALIKIFKRLPFQQSNQRLNYIALASSFIQGVSEVFMLMNIWRTISFAA